MHLTSKRTVIGAEFPNAAIPFPASLISGRVADHHYLTQVTLAMRKYKVATKNNKHKSYQFRTKS
jgi:hypothetical protein